MVALIRLEATGRACHSSNPLEGRNALLSLSHAAIALEELARRLGENPDPELGPGTLSVGQMGGGQAPNIVPDSGFLVADRRLLPGETVEHVRTQVEEALSQAGLSDDVALVACGMGKPPLSTSVDHFSVHQCRRIRDLLFCVGVFFRNEYFEYETETLYLWYFFNTVRLPISSDDDYKLVNISAVYLPRIGVSERHNSRV